MDTLQVVAYSMKISTASGLYLWLRLLSWTAWDQRPSTILTYQSWYLMDGPPAEICIPPPNKSSFWTASSRRIWLEGKNNLRNVKEQHKSCSHSVPPSNVGSFMCEPRPNARQQKSSNCTPTLKEKFLITTRVGDPTGTYRQTFPNSECGHETLSS